MFVVGQAVVDRAVRRKIEHQIRKVLHRTLEHIGTNLFTWLSLKVITMF